MNAPLHRWCKDLGMFAVDRPYGNNPGSSCKHATRQCIKDCFNYKFTAMYPEAMARSDANNERSWITISGEALARALDRKRNQTDRFRFMTRGETFKDMSDFERVIDIAEANPDRVHWIPTKAWRRPMFRHALNELRKMFPNLRILASTDTTTTEQEQKILDDEGWSTMFFGDDSQLDTLTGSPRFKCPKTWGHDGSASKESVKAAKGSCGDPSRCASGGCFDASKPVHVHLKKH